MCQFSYAQQLCSFHNKVLWHQSSRKFNYHLRLSYWPCLHCSEGLSKFSLVTNKIQSLNQIILIHYSYNECWDSCFKWLQAEQLTLYTAAATEFFVVKLLPINLSTSSHVVKMSKKIWNTSYLNLFFYILGKIFLKHTFGRYGVETYDSKIKTIVEKNPTTPLKKPTQLFSPVSKITSVTSSGCYNIKKHCEK